MIDGFPQGLRHLVPGRIVWPLLEPYLGRSSGVNALIPRLTRRPYPTEEPSWKDSLAADNVWKDSLAAGILL
jgi:hypothetical protein